jgi:hypothetical protein
MMKKLLLFIFIFILVSISVQSQTDSLRNINLDKLNEDELLQYYINEAEPYPFYKGPIEVGDSVYNILNPQTIPTQTVDAEPLYRADVEELKAEEALLDTTNTKEQKLKPKIALGTGLLAFHGDLYKKHFQSPLTSRPGVDLNISQRMTRYLQLNFTALFGKLGANEFLNNRQENFQSEIRAGGINLVYDFGNFISDAYRVRPFVSFGAMGFEYLSKTDLRDKNGIPYHYWSDADAQFAKNLVRDYRYESDVRELNKDGFGKYQERAWAFPIGAGFIMKVTDRVDCKLNFQYFISTTDYIDGISKRSIDNRKGTKQKDNFSYTSISLQYDLITKRKKKVNPAIDTLNNSFWLAIDDQDTDKDGVPDLKDDCAGTPDGAKVDIKGCPIDEDNDGIPNYRDDELNTLAGMPVNERGVGQGDDYWKEWYANYLNDTLGKVEIELVGNYFKRDTILSEKSKGKKKKKNNEEEVFTVELARYDGAIPADELAFLLSIGDINTATLDDGTTIVYTNANIDKISNAVKRRDEFRTQGNKSAGISRVKGKNIVPVSDAELEKLLQQEMDELLTMKINSNDTSAISLLKLDLKENETKNEEIFNKEDIVYRVQLGAFKNRISTKVFNTSTGVIELKTGENIYRYVTTGYKTIEDAAATRADLVIQGYSDAFVSAYKNGKRILLSETKAHVEGEYKEDLSENKMFSSIDKKLVIFKIQLGPLKKRLQENGMDERVKEILDIDKQTTASGSIRYSTGNFPNQEAAEKYRTELESKGFSDAFIIATFKNEIISIQEAIELLK